MSKSKIFSKILVFMFAIFLMTPLATYTKTCAATNTARLKNIVKQEKMTNVKRQMLSSKVPDNLKPSLDGCVFGVYSDSKCSNLLDKVTIKDNGDGTFSGVNANGQVLPAGKVYIKELKAAKGYKINNKVYEQTIKADEQVEITIKNDLDIPNPVLKKTADVKTVKPGDVVTYTVSFTNPSDINWIYGYKLSDTIDYADLGQFVEGSLKTEFPASMDNTKDFKVTEFAADHFNAEINMAPGASGKITYQTKIDNIDNRRPLKNTLSTSLTLETKVKVSTSVVNGTISPAEVMWYDTGKTSTIESTSNQGFKFSKLIVDGKEYTKENTDFIAKNVDITSNDGVTTVKCNIPNLQQDHDVRVEYEPDVDITKPVKKFDKNSYDKGDVVKSTISIKQNGSKGSVAENVVLADKSTDSLKLDIDSIKVDYKDAEGNALSSGYVVKPNAAKDGFEVQIEKFKAGETLEVHIDGKALGTKAKVNNTATVIYNQDKQEVTTTAESTYKISTTVVNGTITESATGVPYDSNKNIEYTPNKGFELDKITVDGKEVDKNTFKDKYAFNNIKDNHTIVVEYKGTNTPKLKKAFSVEKAKIGDVVKNTITYTNEGVKEAVVKNVVIEDHNQGGMEIDMDSIKVSSPSNVKTSLNKTKDSFTVTAPEVKGGETITITFDSIVTKSVEKLSNEATATGDNVKKITGKAEATPVYTITTTVTNGNITPKSDIDRGGDKNIEYTPNDGYELDKVKVDGKEVDKEKFKDNYNFTNITENHEIEVIYKGTPKPTIEKTFDKEKYKLGETVKNTITYTNTGVADSVIENLVIKDNNINGMKIDMNSINITTTGDTKATLNKGDNSFTVTSPKVKGTETIKITFNSVFNKNVEKISNEVTASGDNQKPITGKAESIPEYSITTKVNNGEITPNSDIERGGSKKIEYTPHDGFELDKVVVDGKEVDKNTFKNEYNFENITDNHNIEVFYKGIPTPKIEKTFDKKEYKVGDTIKAKVVVKDTGKEGAVSHDLIIKDANKPGFKIKTDTIKAESTSGKANVEVINPETGEFKVTLNELSNKDTLTITYDMEITKEAGKLENTATLITKEYPNGIPSTATGNLTIDINTSVTGGTITESKTGQKYGTDVPVTYTPNDGYYLYKIEIDGKEVKTDGIENKYEFKNIQDNHSINVTYKKIPTPVLTKTTEKQHYVKDEIVKYTIKMTTDAEMENVVLKDVFEKNFEEHLLLNKDSIKLNGEAVPYSESYNIEKVAAGKDIILTYEAKVISDEEKPIKNDVSVIARGMNKEITSSKTVNLHEIPNLKVFKSSDKKTYRKGDIVKYKVVIKNEGKATARNISIKDKVDKPDLISINNNSFKLNGKSVTIDNLKVKELAPGKEISLTYEGKVLKDVISKVDNTVEVTAFKVRDTDGKELTKSVVTKYSVNLEKTPKFGPKTGDNTNAIIFLAASLGAILAITAIIAKKRDK